MKTVYQTADGRVFETEDGAENWESILPLIDLLTSILQETRHVDNDLTATDARLLATAIAYNPRLIIKVIPF